MCHTEAEHPPLCVPLEGREAPRRGVDLRQLITCYPHDAMIARYNGPMSTCVRINLCFIEMSGRIELILALRLLLRFDLSYTVMQGNSANYKNKGTSLWK